MPHTINVIPLFVVVKKAIGKEKETVAQIIFFNMPLKISPILISVRTKINHKHRITNSVNTEAMAAPTDRNLGISTAFKVIFSPAPMKAAICIIFERFEAM